MEKLIDKVKNLTRDEDGATLVEYAILAALLSIAAIAIIVTVGKQINAALTDASSKMANGGM